MIHLGVEKFLEAVDYGPNKAFLAHLAHCSQCKSKWDGIQEKIKKQHQFTQKEVDLYGEISDKGL